MADPFDPITINGLRIRNRFQRSATWDASATADGEVTDDSLRIIGGLAKGGVGLVVTGYAYVSDEGKAAVNQYGIADDRHIPGLIRLVVAAHEQGAAIAAQIGHGGLNRRLLLQRDVPAKAPSKIEGHPWEHEAMTPAEVEEAVESFVQAAVRAHEAGFDAVQLHGAHGYLMTQFLSPLLNHRDDEWGGTLEKRRRFHLEVIRGVRRALGGDFPLLMKLGIFDAADGGMSLEEGIDALKAFVAAGLDGVELSVGTGTGSTQTARLGDPERVYFRDKAAAVKKSVGIPVALVGGIRSFATAQEILSADADMVSLSRPLIREPGLIARWQNGDTSPAKCISCNKCFSFVIQGQPLQCGEEYRLRQGAAEQVTPGPN